MILISADFRNGVIQPLHTDEETTTAVGSHVANYMLEKFPFKDALTLESFNRLKENKKYTFRDLYFLASMIKDTKGEIKLVDDDLLKTDNYILVAKKVKAALIIMPKSIPFKASQLKGMRASANQIFQTLGAWEAIERNPDSSKHKVKRSRLEQGRIHRLLRKSRPDVDVFTASCISISKMAWGAIERYGFTVIKEQFTQGGEMQEAPDIISSKEEMSNWHGLQNITNSCYIASAIQAIRASSFLKTRIELPLVKGAEESESHFAEREKVQKALITLLNALENGEKLPKHLRDFRSALFANKTLNSDLSLYGEYQKDVFDRDLMKRVSPLNAQQDAAQLMQVIFEVLDLNVYQQELWYGENATVGQTPVTAEKLIELPLSGFSLQDIINQRFQRNQAAPGQFIEAGDSKVSKLEEESRLLGAPEILLVRLKRFGWDQQNNCPLKNCAPVTLPPNLEVDLSAAFKTEGPQPYRIASIIRHSGNTLFSGHYVARIRQNDEWITCDDDLVYRSNSDSINDNELLQNYLFLLERKN